MERSMQTACVLLLLSVFAGLSDAGEFRAAAARSDITPAGSEPLWGFSNRSGPATGTLDPLYAKVVVLDDQTMRLAIVTLDLGRTFNPESMSRVRERVKSSANVAQVLFCASHTHSGPVISDAYPSGNPPKWEQTALTRIAETIEQAANRLASAKIGVGTGETLIGHNRRALQPDGTVKMLWRNAEKKPTKPVDPRVGVIRIDDTSGKTIAVFVNYACHPVVLGPENLQYSADYPSAMSALVEESMGDGTVCLFLQGAAGDINPYYDKMTLGEDAVRLMKETGQQLGKEVVRVAKAINPTAPENSRLAFALDTLHFKPRWNVDKALEILKPRLAPEVFARYRDYLAVALDCPVMSLVINNDIALAGMPGEPFVDFGTAYRARSPVKNSFFVGYANGYFGYFPTIEAASVGGYGADSIVTRAEVGAGEAMLNQAIVRHYELLGKLKSTPSN